MNTIIRTIFGIAVATSAGAILAILLTPKKSSMLRMKFKSAGKEFLNDLPILKTEKYQPIGEMTSELIEMEQFETYTTK